MRPHGFWRVAPTLFAALIGTWASSASSASFTPGNIVVFRVGDGIKTLAGTGNPVFLDEYQSDGKLVNSLPMPTEANALNKPFAGGGTAAEKKMLAEAAARPTSNKGSATTGGDVSRFWVPVSGRVSAPRQQPQQQAYNGGGAPAMGAPAAPRGPVVRVTRGDKVTEVPVGGK